MRIGILGGTFNPVHLGHLLLAEGARETLELDQILWIPARIPPHKEPPGQVSAEQRARMVELAISDNPAFRLSRVELERPAPSYTIDTVHQLRQQEISTVSDWFFLIGSDTAGELESWREIGQLKTLVQFVAIPRPGRPATRVPEVRQIPVQTLDVSSSEVRQRIRENRSIRYWVPESVRLYIEEHRLYR